MPPTVDGFGLEISRGTRFAFQVNATYLKRTSIRIY